MNRHLKLSLLLIILSLLFLSGAVYFLDGWRSAVIFFLAGLGLGSGVGACIVFDY